MKKLAMTFLALATLLFVLNAPINAQQLKNIKKIYLAPFGNDVISDLVREKIRTRLMSSNHFTVVEKPEDADAILTGVADFMPIANGNVGGVSGRAGNGSIWGDVNTDFNAVGVFKLVDPESKTTLWIYDYKPKWYRISTTGNLANEEYNRLAKRVVEKLTKDGGASNRK